MLSKYCILPQATWTYIYDGFGRVKSKSSSNTECSSEYLSQGTRAYQQIKKVTDNSTDGTLKFSVAYDEYDGQGNIKKETERCNYTKNSDTKLNYTTTRSYTYDSQNRLKSVNDNNHSYSYNYDSSGRLESMNYNGFPRTLQYDSRGRLKSSLFSGNGADEYSYNFVYDNYGNRTEKRKYGSNSLLEKYTWTQGKLLEKITDGNGNEKGSYIYGINGIRFSKTVNGVTTTYYYNGKTLMGEDHSKNGGLLQAQVNRRLRYCYDREGICGFRYQGSSVGWYTYTYVKNAQGDIILIKDENGTPRVKYEYDPWGNVTYSVFNYDNYGEITDEELAKLNPIRYRGYYYDEESKLYYLMTRYYDPWAGQFISPDSFDFLDPETIGGVNLYAYCNYNPVMNVDPSGHLFFTILLIGIVAGAAIGATVNGVQAYKDGARGWEVVSAVAKGAVVGGLIGAAAGAVAGAGAVLISSGMAALGGGLGAAALAGGGVVGGSAVVVGGGAILAGGALTATGVVGGLLGLNVWFAKIPKHGEPNSTINQGGSTGQYDENGNLISRKDRRGRPHWIDGYGYKLPHTHIFEWYKHGDIWRFIETIWPF